MSINHHELSVLISLHEWHIKLSLIEGLLKDMRDNVPPYIFTNYAELFNVVDAIQRSIRVIDKEKPNVAATLGRRRGC